VQKVTVSEEPRERTRPVAPSEATIARSARRAAELHAAIESEEQTPYCRSIRTELSALVERTNTPGFWDDAAVASATMERLYQLERVLERFDALRRRAEGLDEMARQVQRSRQRTRLPELRQAIGEVEVHLEVARLELAGAAAGGESSEIVVRVTPVGEADEWAESLVEMYRAWAERTGRPVSRDEESGRSLTIGGPSTWTLMRHEAGLHRRLAPEGDQSLARVSVLDGRPEAVRDGEDAVIVRVYSQGRRQFVRDPRTGASVGDVSSVLAGGKIDEFLLAALKL
jgi:peptide chain release factor 2